MSRFFSFIGVFLLSQSTFAYDLISPIDAVTPAGAGGDYGINLLSNMIAYAIGIAAVLGVIGITWGGIMMVLSSGDDEKAKKARYIIIYAMVGVLLAGTAYGIVSLISDTRIGF